MLLVGGFRGAYAGVGGPACCARENQAGAAH